MNRKRILAFIISALMLISVPLSFAYWNRFDNAFFSESLGFTVGEYLDEGASPLDRLPSETPQNIVDQVSDMINSSVPEAVVDALVDAITNLVNYPGFDGDMYFDKTLDDIFNNQVGSGNSVSADSVLIYTVEENGVTEYVIVHIPPNSNANISSVQQLLDALGQTWTGVNMISPVWQSGNLYSTFHAPVEYQGRKYLMYHNGPAGTPPANARGAWFEVVEGFRFDSANNYFPNYVVEHNGNYFISRWQNNATPDINNQWGAWNALDWYNQNTNYLGGALVVTSENGEVKFWRALQNTNFVAPSEDSARAGVWRQFTNGWIGRSGDNTIKSYYYAHNIYSQNDIVVYGISPKMQYKYFVARRPIPADQPPMIVNAEGHSVLNDFYWEYWT